MPMSGHRAGCGCAVRPEDDAVIDIGFSGHICARTRGMRPPGKRYDETLGSSLPVLARRVRAELAALAIACGAEAVVAQLCDSAVLT